MKNKPSSLTDVLLVSAILASASALAEENAFSVWAVDDMVKINPETGKAFEQKESLYKSALTGDLRASNWIWDGKTVSLEGARNEAVGWQIIVAPKDGQTLHAVNCSASPLLGETKDKLLPAANVTFYRAWYIPATVANFACSLGIGNYPDALVPFSFGPDKRGAPFDIPDAKNLGAKQKNQAIFVDTYIPANTAPGTYTGKITITATEGQFVLPVKLTVHAFTMPEEHSFHYWGFSYGEIDRKADEKVRLEYYRIAQAHRFFIGVITSSIRPTFSKGAFDFSEYDKRVAPMLDGTAFRPEDGYGPAPGANMPVTDYCTPIAWDPVRFRPNDRRPSYWPMSEQETSGSGGEATLIAALQSFHKHLEEKGWTKKTRQLIFINGLDEPRRKPDLDKVCQYCDWIAKAGVPFYYGIALNGFDDVLSRCGTNAAEFVARVGKAHVDWLTTANRGMNAATFAGDMMKNPNHICNFDGCREPVDGSPHTDCEQLALRVNVWLSRKYSPLFNGYLLWSVDMNDNKVWDNADNYDGKLNGMAFLIYPAEEAKHGIGLPVPSIRCKALRRGLQDYELMHALDRSGHEAEVQQIVDGVVQSGWDKTESGKFETNPNVGQWNHNPKDWYEARHKLLLLASKPGK